MQVTVLGYARVSTQAQDLEPQLRQLRAAGCTEIFEEKASGTSRTRPELARLLNRLRAGDTLVVVRIDRLARSLSHLLTVIERVCEGGGHFRSLSDPIDTAAREQARFTALLPGADAWLAVVRRLRPAQSWDEVTEAVNAALLGRAHGACRAMRRLGARWSWPPRSCAGGHGRAWPRSASSCRA
jgi:hypothetical protein